MASLFRRKSAELVADQDNANESAAAPEPEPKRPKGYTPSKKELGVATPKRPAANPRLASSEIKLTKEERRAKRREAMEGMRRGDERYLLPRDKGPERALARDVVDSRRTVGTWFFAGAVVVLIGSSTQMPPVIRLAANLLWALLAIALLLDAYLLCRKLKKLLRERFPDSKERRGSLYLYVVMRSITFRRLRIPQPRVEFGDDI
ncbi:MAG TPA: DUF3043 domain-containing protein [Natronosporangium sp.]